jgi:cysteine synthase
MFNLERNPEKVEENAAYCKERGIILPTFNEMSNPETIKPEILDDLKKIGLWDLHPRNLFRITWSNEPKEQGGLFSNVNYLVLTPELTGCKARIVALVGKWFPTGAHKVGATYGCLAPRLVTGQFDPKRTKAVWPSTGNYCRGGAYVSSLLGCKSIAILPEQMSRERFDWLKSVAGEVIATPGCESNVKEIFDKCWELKQSREDIMIFNQFEEFGNPTWHYHITGPAFEKALNKEMRQGDRLFAAVLSSGSAGTLGAGYYLKNKFGNIKIAAAEALQCPTLLNNGFGGHRIEGIGDKHVPWIHDIKNTDVVIAVDDNVTMRLLRLFNHEKGKKMLKENGVSEKLIESLDLLGISGIGNLIASIKLAKYFELNDNDFIVTVLTDSMKLYGSRLKELEEKLGEYTEYEACRDMECLNGINIDNMQELNYYEKRRIHNLKYFTWIEQQGRALDELNDQWYDHENYWSEIANSASKIDDLICDFNNRVEI